MQSIYTTDGAFAALKQDGTVVTWGFAYNGGDSSAVPGINNWKNKPWMFQEKTSNDISISWMSITIHSHFFMILLQGL